MLHPQLPDELTRCAPLPAPPKKRIVQKPGQADAWATFGSQVNDYIADLIEAHGDCASKLEEIGKLMGESNGRPGSPDPSP